VHLLVNERYIDSIMHGTKIKVNSVRYYILTEICSLCKNVFRGFHASRRLNVRTKKNKSGSATDYVGCPEILLHKVAYSRSDAP